MFCRDALKMQIKYSGESIYKQFAFTKHLQTNLNLVNHIGVGGMGDFEDSVMHMAQTNVNYACNILVFLFSDP